jgi:hypothetical protein
MMRCADTDARCADSVFVSVHSTKTSAAEVKSEKTSFLEKNKKLKDHIAHLRLLVEATQKPTLTLTLPAAGRWPRLALLCPSLRVLLW